MYVKRVIGIEIQVIGHIDSIDSSDPEYVASDGEYDDKELDPELLKEHVIDKGKLGNNDNGAIFGHEDDKRVGDSDNDLKTLKGLNDKGQNYGKYQENDNEFSSDFLNGLAFINTE